MTVTKDAAGTCRDPKDAKFLALAASGKAAYIVTGNQDLLVLQLFMQTRIITVSELLGMI